NLSLFDLRTEPLLQSIEQRFAFGLMEEQALVSREAALPGQGIVAIHLGDGFEHVANLVGKRALDIDELATSVSGATGEQRHELVGEIARETIAHLNG